jgi:hypothetical protein
MAEHDLRAVAFPTLNEVQIEKLGSCAGAFLKKHPDGQTLFKVGERDFKFFVVKSGEVEIIDESGDAEDRHDSSARRVHRRGGAAYRQPCCRQRHRTWRYRSVRNVSRVCATVSKHVPGSG